MSSVDKGPVFPIRLIRFSGRASIWYLGDEGPFRFNFFVTEGGDYCFEEARLAAVTKLFVLAVSAFST